MTREPAPHDDPDSFEYDRRYTGYEESGPGIYRYIPGIVVGAIRTRIVLDLGSNKEQ